MSDREEEFSNLMENMYVILRLMNKYNMPRHYGTADELYLNEVHTLKCIAEHPGISLSELGERTHRTKGATSMMINKLESKGLVSKRCAAADVRRYELNLTEKGEQVDRFHLSYDEVHYRDMLDFVPDAQAADFRRVNQILEGLIRYYLS